MIIQINLNQVSGHKVNRLAKLLAKLNGDQVRDQIKQAHRQGFNPKVDKSNGRLVGYVCRDCGKNYKSAGWLARHKRKH